MEGFILLACKVLLGLFAYAFSVAFSELSDQGKDKSALAILIIAIICLALLGAL